MACGGHDTPPREWSQEDLDHREENWRVHTIKGVPGLDFGDKAFRPPAVNFLTDASSYQALSEAGHHFKSRADDMAACIAEANLNRLLLSAQKHKDLWTSTKVTGYNKKEGKPAFFRAICEDLGDGTPGIVEFLLRAAMTARRRYRKRVREGEKIKPSERKVEGEEGGEGEDEDVVQVPAVAAADVLCRHEATVMRKEASLERVEAALMKM
ncbi:hypothetical protein SLS62_007518 [Diatrype stigma]|uniref:Uncharacterized protein n=1 Tax=Diatrype stigma TaxID=117547 RepID=A0AAN9YQ79_9PEZI